MKKNIFASKVEQKNIFAYLGTCHDHDFVEIAGVRYLDPPYFRDPPTQMYQNFATPPLQVPIKIPQSRCVSINI